MGIFPVEFPTTTVRGYESSSVLHYLGFIKKGGDGKVNKLSLALIGRYPNTLSAACVPNILTDRLFFTHLNFIIPI